LTVRWGILGCGNVCEVKSGPAFQRARGSELVAVMRRDRAKAEDFARRHGVPAFYDDADALLADPRVDAVYVATPPGSHLELAVKVAAAGKPCYVEKPMARSHAECLRMVQAFELRNLPLFVAYYRRALDRFVKAKELIDSGRLGEILGIEVRYASDAQLRLDRADLPWRLQAEQAGGGLFVDLASHTLDVLDFWFGPLQGVTGEAVQVAAACDVEDRVTLCFSTRLGARGSGEWNFCASTPEDAIIVTGSQATLRMSTFGEHAVELDTGSEVESFRLPNPAHIQQPLIQSTVDALLERGSCASSGVSAARTSDVMDRALSSYYGDRAAEFWREPARWPGRRVTR
jgi:predicted dehydrogenase